MSFTSSFSFPKIVYFFCTNLCMFLLYFILKSLFVFFILCLSFLSLIFVTSFPDLCHHITDLEKRWSHAFFSVPYLIWVCFILGVFVHTCSTLTVTLSLGKLCVWLCECVCIKCVSDMKISWVLLCLMLVGSVTPGSAAGQVRAALHFKSAKSIDHCWKNRFYFLIKNRYKVKTEKTYKSKI